MTKLTELIARGPNPARGITALVLREFRQIEQARGLLWDWATIATALDLPPGPRSAKALRAAFARVRLGIRDKTLEPPPAGGARAGAISPRAAMGEAAKTGDQPAQAGQRQSNKEFLASLKQIGGDK